MNKNIISAVVSGGLFLLLILLVSFVDVQTVPATGMEMGLSHINFAFSNLIGVNPLLYTLTTVLGIFLILVVVWFGLKGLMQLIHRKSLLKVDREILTLGGLYVVLALVYVFFEKVIINYRPIIMEGETEAEASFPSSHTMLVCVVMGSAIMLLGRYIKDEKTRRVLKIVFYLVIAVTVLGRLFSGVHWLTDILGGVLISICLLSIFAILLPKREDQSVRYQFSGNLK